MCQVALSLKDSVCGEKGIILLCELWMEKVSLYFEQHGLKVKQVLSSNGQDLATLSLVVYFGLFNTIHVGSAMPHMIK